MKKTHYRYEQKFSYTFLFLFFNSNWGARRPDCHMAARASKAGAGRRDGH